MRASGGFMDSYSVIEFDYFKMEIYIIGVSETSLVIYQSTPCNIQKRLGIATFVAARV
jgi:hypothetical protein